MPSKRPSSLLSLLAVLALVWCAVAAQPAAAASIDRGGHGVGGGTGGGHHHDGEEGDHHGGDAQDWCGTNRSNLALALGIAHSHERQRTRISTGEPRLDEKHLTAPSVEAVGDIAVVSDDRVLRPVNPVDIADFGMVYTPKAKTYAVTNGAAGVASAPGTRLDLGDDATVFVPFPKGFKPKFFGKAQTGMFVNTDGNITFGAGDDASTERGLQRFLYGPGRIAPLFLDLDPTIGGAGSGVFVSTSKTAAIVTWFEVPEFGAAGRRNTFQVKIEKSGRVTFAYGALGSREAVVGIAPGDGGAFTIVDYRGELPVTLAGAVVEDFSLTERLDDIAAAGVFLQSFADRYDSVIVWIDFPYQLGAGAFAYEFSIKNDIRGIGQPLFDATREVGSRGRLSSFVQMGSLGNYPSNPHETFLGTNTTMDVLGQEVGHRWLAFVAVFQPGNPSLLGRALSHWSFLFDSQASDMEGNGYRDNGNGTFTTVEATSRYSELDQYIMGLRSPGEVSDMFYIDGAGNRSAPPEVGLTISGTRRDVQIQDIIAAEGPRVPAPTASPSNPKTFNMAFVLVTRPGEAPRAGSIEKLERIRNDWSEYFVQATDGRGRIDSTLVPR